MLHDIAQVLPRPGPVWGDYPLRAAQDTAPPWRWPRLGSAGFCCRRIAKSAAPHAQAWLNRNPAERAAALPALRQRLRREGLAGQALAQALGVVSASAEMSLGWAPRSTQLLAAAALLDNRMAEMATGEGKTLAIALAAAVAALAGLPVHVVTANDYLAARDAQQMAPLFAALGLSGATLSGAVGDAARRAVYGHDVVYATAKDLAFDFLRDRQSASPEQAPQCLAAAVAGAQGPQSLMRGLSMALLDEADSILLDEAEVPLILSRAAPQAARRAFLWQALALARQLDEGRDFVVQRADRLATLSADGEQRLAVLAQRLGGPWHKPRYRREAVQVALSGLHAHHRDEHYLVRDGAIELLDEVTGRVAVGRVWSRGLHTVVALKEGLSPPPETETIAQTTFQRFFQRYWRLCGISGTLWEARHELHQVYGATVLRIPLHRPCRRRTLPARCFDSAEARFSAVAERAAALQGQGRPVLIGTDSVADSQRVAAALACRGVEHRVLNALHDAHEAAIVASAGRAGQVTVATRMAGRGTDIELDDAARAAGGLHVLSCQDNPSHRLDRQLAGRAGRHGDPGSAESWLCLSPCAQPTPPPADNPTICDTKPSAFHAPWFAATSRRWTQRREDARRCELRRRLLEQDREWERRLSFAGPAA